MKECDYEGCSKRVVGNGLCAGHYKQVERGKELSALREAQTSCSFPDCDRPHHAQSYCDSHYKQQQRGMSPQEIRKWVRKQTEEEEN